MFHLILTICLILAAMRYSEWRRWQTFLPTIYYVAFFNMYYQFISSSIKPLWQVERPFISTFITETMYGFILLPCLTILFLSYFPDTKRGKFLYYGKYILVSLLIEFIALKLHYFKLSHGWHIGWEVFFYPIMYLSMHLHLTRPRFTLILSGLVIIFLLIVFDINVV